MFKLFPDRSSHDRRSLLCFIFICVLAICFAHEKPEFDQLTVEKTNRSSTIVFPENDFQDVFTNELSGYSVVRYISSRNTELEKPVNVKASLLYAAVNSLIVLTGTFVLFHICIYRFVVTSHQFIISYIQNLDGMKP